MNTVRVAIDPRQPDPGVLAQAADILRQGGLVAFPTETVYGLAAHALDPQAVSRIYEAKGRPAGNPLIVHTADIAAARTLTTDWTAAAERLARRFWPGPVSLVVARAECVPAIVAGGGSSVALRVPQHPVALGLLQAAGIPLAAPSANRSTHITATTADHVERGLAGRIDMILDAGATPGGLESTVVDVRSRPATLLRPGLLAREALMAALGEEIAWHGQQASATTEPQPSPGMMTRHYAPHVAVECVDDDGRAQIEHWARSGVRVGWLAFGKPTRSPAGDVVVQWLPREVTGYTAGLFAALHDLEAAGVERMVIALPPDRPQWLAVRDRLRRASAPK